MDRYETDWLDEIADYLEYDEDTRKILLLLCHRQYKWRTESRLATAAGLDVDDVAAILDELRKQGVVTMSLSKQKRVIFGISARVRQKSVA